MKEDSFRNVMDMKANYGGFAAALQDKVSLMCTVQSADSMCSCSLGCRNVYAEGGEYESPTLGSPVFKVIYTLRLDSLDQVVFFGFACFLVN